LARKISSSTRTLDVAKVATTTTNTRDLRGLHGSYGPKLGQLASGGQAVIHRLDDPSLVYKQFKRPPRRSVERDELSSRLRLLVGFGRRVFVERGEQVGESPESSFCWPIDVVETSGVVDGIVMPTAPIDFFDSSGKGLTIDRLYLWRATPQPASVRIRVLVSVLHSFGGFHAPKLIHGDIQPKNILWSKTRPGRILILDIDGVHREGDPYFGYVQTGEWNDPRVAAGTIPGHDLASDRYALCLLAARVLLGSRFPTDVAGRHEKIESPWLPDPVAHAINDALQNPLDAARRVNADELATLLQYHFFPSGRPDVAALAKADVLLASRRRTERRSGTIGPPYTHISNALKAGELCN
jgi:hypothetical protein